MKNRLQGIGMTSQRTRDRLVARLREKGIKNEQVLAAIASIPRHIFVDEALSSRAYEDTALPIGDGQTISQPFIVARMTELLIADPKPGKILEIGTGSGYQTAILAQLVHEVYSIERIEGLLHKAAQRLVELNVDNVYLRQGDGYQGWKKMAPFEAILLTAAPAQVPEELLQQLAPEGRLVAPIGKGDCQQLTLIYNTVEGVVSKQMDLVTFVPMVGEKR